MTAASDLTPGTRYDTPRRCDVCGAPYQQHQYGVPFLLDHHRRTRFTCFSFAAKRHSMGKIGQGHHEDFSHKDTLSHAIDFSLPVGTPVLAARGGVVVDLADHFSKGGLNEDLKRKANFVVVRHDDGTYARYFHLHPNSVRVQIGESVKLGAELAHSGNTGYTGGPHLHFDVVDSYGTEVCELVVRGATGTFNMKTTLALFCTPPDSELTLNLIAADPLLATTTLANAGSVCGTDAVLCSRGESTFLEKACVVETSGASAAIVFDNERDLKGVVPMIGKFQSTKDLGHPKIPVLFVSYASGKKLLKLLGKGGHVQVVVRPSNFKKGSNDGPKTTPDGEQVAEFHPITVPFSFIDTHAL